MFLVAYKRKSISILFLGIAVFALLTGCVAPATPAVAEPAVAQPSATQASATQASATTDVPPTTAPEPTAIPPTAAPAPTAAPTEAPTATPAPTAAPTVAPTAVPTEAPTQAPTTAAVSFAKDILPVFEQSCVKCHGGEKTEEGLSLKTYEDVLKGSKNGAVIEPGNPANSYLVDQIAKGKMPKRAQRLSDEIVLRISDWVAAGAPNN